MNFIDSHCHLDFAEFDQDRDQVWRRAGQGGLAAAIIPGVDPSQWPKAANIAKSLQGVYYAVGLHPWWVQKYIAQKTNEVRALRELTGDLHSGLKGSHCVALGECGLDKNIALPLEKQRPFFELQLDIAGKSQRPVIIHAVKSHNEVIASLNKHSLPRGGVIHAFSGSLEIARAYVNLGFYLGIGGTITYERATKTREAVRRMPLDALLLETDAPDMPLAGRQGQRNSPEHVSDVAATLAQLRNESIRHIAERTTENAKRLFGVG